MKHDERARLYNERWPSRPGLSWSDTMIGGCWQIGACYKNPARMPDGSPFYGGYPHGYLDRVHAMFPEVRNVLHVFYGDRDRKLGGPSPVTLVDMHGPEQGRYPTWQGDVLSMPEAWTGRFDLVLADPPYSAADAVKYDCPAPNRGKIMRALRRVTAKAGNLVWLDQVWPMHRKDEWKTWGTVGLVRSTNHRVRMVSFFEAV